MKLNILLVGEAKPSGRLVAYAKAFTHVGHEVKVCDTDPLYATSVTNRFVNKALSVPVYFGTGRLNDAVIAQARQSSPHFVLFFKPIYIRPQTVESLEALGARTFSWYPDDAFYAKNASRDFYAALPHYDCHFTTKSFNVAELHQHGARKAVFLPHAVDADYHAPVEPTPEERRRFGAEVLFAGTYADDKRVDYLERLCLAGHRIRIYGNSWEKLRADSPLRKNGAVQFRAIYGRDLSLAINSSAITVAFLRGHNRDVQTARTYEIPACGGFMLHERTDEATAIFREGEHADYFDSFEEFRSKVEHYLQRPEERNRIARQGCQRARMADLSYGARAEQIIRTYEEIKLECAA